MRAVCAPGPIQISPLAGPLSPLRIPGVLGEALSEGAKPRDGWMHPSSVQADLKDGPVAPTFGFWSKDEAHSYYKREELKRDLAIMTSMNGQLDKASPEESAGVRGLLELTKSGWYIYTGHPKFWGFDKTFPRKSVMDKKAEEVARFGLLYGQRLGYNDDQNFQTFVMAIDMSFSEAYRRNPELYVEFMAKKMGYDSADQMRQMHTDMLVSWSVSSTEGAMHVGHAITPREIAVAFLIQHEPVSYWPQADTLILESDEETYRQTHPWQFR